MSYTAQSSMLSRAPSESILLSPSRELVAVAENFKFSSPPGPRRRPVARPVVVYQIDMTTANEVSFCVPSHKLPLSVQVAAIRLVRPRYLGGLRNWILRDMNL